MFSRLNNINKALTTSSSKVMPKNTFNPLVKQADKIQAPHSTKVIRIGKKSQAIQELAVDNKGVHPHKITEICMENNCEKKKCLGNICNTLKKIKTDGYFTHKPIAGKYTRFISDKDGNNKNDTQYFCKNTDKNKEIDAQKAAHYIQNNQLKDDTKMTTFINQPEISAKLE